MTRSVVDDVFLGSDAIRHGLATPDTLRGKRWRRLFRNVYISAECEVDHGVRCRGAQLLLPTVGAISRRSAAWLWGADLVIDDHVEVNVPAGTEFGPVTGMRVTHERMGGSDVTTRHGLQVTLPLRTAWDLGRAPDLVDAVTALDAFCRTGMVSAAQLTARLATTYGERGTRRLERALALMDPRAESPQESRVRVMLRLAGVPKPVPQFTVIHRGTFVARLDLAWPDDRVGLEYDGAWHEAPEQRIRDAQRLNRLRHAGWRIIRVTREQMRPFDAVVEKVRSALAGSSDYPLAAAS